MALVLRNVKGSELTFDEMDGNLVYLDGKRLIKDRAPTATDDTTTGIFVRSWWEDTTTGTMYVCTDNTEGAAVWEVLQFGEANELAYDELLDCYYLKRSPNSKVENGIVLAKDSTLETLGSSTRTEVGLMNQADPTTVKNFDLIGTVQYNKTSEAYVTGNKAYFATKPAAKDVYIDSFDDKAATIDYVVLNSDGTVKRQQTVSFAARSDIFSVRPWEENVLSVVGTTVAIYPLSASGIISSDIVLIQNYDSDTPSTTTITDVITPDEIISVTPYSSGFRILYVNSSTHNLVVRTHNITDNTYIENEVSKGQLGNYVINTNKYSNTIIGDLVHYADNSIFDTNSGYAFYTDLSLQVLPRFHAVACDSNGNLSYDYTKGDTLFILKQDYEIFSIVSLQQNSQHASVLEVVEEKVVGRYDYETTNADWIESVNFRIIDTQLIVQIVWYDSTNTAFVDTYYCSVNMRQKTPVVHVTNRPQVFKGGNIEVTSDDCGIRVASDILYKVTPFGTSKITDSTYADNLGLPSDTSNKGELILGEHGGKLVFLDENLNVVVTLPYSIDMSAIIGSGLGSTLPKIVVYHKSQFKLLTLAQSYESSTFILSSTFSLNLYLREVLTELFNFGTTTGLYTSSIDEQLTNISETANDLIFVPSIAYAKNSPKLSRLQIIDTSTSSNYSEPLTEASLASINRIDTIMPTAMSLKAENLAPGNSDALVYSRCGITDPNGSRILDLDYSLQLGFDVFDGKHISVSGYIEDSSFVLGGTDKLNRGLEFKPIDNAPAFSGTELPPFQLGDIFPLNTDSDAYMDAFRNYFTILAFKTSSRTLGLLQFTLSDGSAPSETSIFSSLTAQNFQSFQYQSTLFSAGFNRLYNIFLSWIKIGEISLAQYTTANSVYIFPEFKVLNSHGLLGYHKTYSMSINVCGIALGDTLSNRVLLNHPATGNAGNAPGDFSYGTVTINSSAIPTYLSSGGDDSEYSGGGGPS